MERPACSSVASCFGEGGLRRSASPSRALPGYGGLCPDERRDESSSRVIKSSHAVVFHFILNKKSLDVRVFSTMEEWGKGSQKGLLSSREAILANSNSQDRHSMRVPNWLHHGHVEPASLLLKNQKVSLPEHS